jgi:uncharacterized protein YbbK (DUF523 family)
VSSPPDKTILVSGCLLGLPCRYDGTSKLNRKVIAWLQEQELTAISICPEQLAGLPTPRPATRFTCGDGHAVLDNRGQVCNDQQQPVNELFIKGAMETLKVAHGHNCHQALLKERSPSCGVHQIYLEQDIVSGRGITAALLERNGLQLLSEEDL